MTIIYFILILGAVVFIHELGHFIFAKRAGIYVYEFALGMGPRIFKFRRKKKTKDKKGKITYEEDETIYSIRLFPIGGFVSMAGEEIEEDKNIPAEKRFQSKPWIARLLTIIAGVIFNFILAIVLLFIIGLANGVTLNSTKLFFPAQLTEIDESRYPTLKEDDRVVKVDGKEVKNRDELILALENQGMDFFYIEVLKSDGKTEQIRVMPQMTLDEEGNLVGYNYGFTIQNAFPALQDGDRIVKIAGKKINNYDRLVLELQVQGTNSFVMQVKKADGTISDIEVKAEEILDSKGNVIEYRYGFTVTGDSYHDIWGALRFAFGKFSSTIQQMFFTILYLCNGTLSLNMLSGPIGIYNIVGMASERGLTSLVSLLAFISINVGFINFLPLPAFDGGRILFLIIEKIKGSPVSAKIENTIHYVAFILLMILMVVITYNDILRFF